MKQQLITFYGEQMLLIDTTTEEELTAAWLDIETLAAAHNITTQQIRIRLNGKERISFAELMLHCDRAGI